MKDGITNHRKECREKLHNTDKIPVLLMASYCGDCTDRLPCEDCLKMCNIVLVEKENILSNNVICGYDFIR